MVQVLIGVAEILGVMAVVAAALIGVTLFQQRRAVQKLGVGDADATADGAGDSAAQNSASEAVSPTGLTNEQLAAVAVAVADYAARRSQAAPQVRVVEPGSRLFASRWVTVGRGVQHQSWARR
ncbi:MAG: hypothetical protein LBR32_05805 [Propionibacteriaceae bacterium]|jgi:hypothetical protein|nr:hypothetical protein [Propionibacteriaceae bacterium]